MQNNGGQQRIGFQLPKPRQRRVNCQLWKVLRWLFCSRLMQLVLTFYPLKR